MNIGNNNFNSNNYNTQNNNEISNSQSLSNNYDTNGNIYQNQNMQQNVNNQNINNVYAQSQQQIIPNMYKQPINQMNIQQPTQQPMNSFENSNTDQSFNGKPPKKMNLGLIIGIIVVIVAIIVVSVMLFGNSANKDNNKSSNSTSDENVSQKNKYENEDIIYDIHKTSGNDESITKLTFTFNGKTLTYPFTLKDIENLGILVDNSDKAKQINANSGMGNITVFTGKYTEENKITLNVFNETGDTLSAGDCIVNYINTTNNKVSVNGITPGVTNYKNILERFGRDDEKRKNTFYNENIRQINEGSFSATMNYSSQNEKFLWCYLDISLDVDYENNTLVDKVYRVAYRQGR